MHLDYDRMALVSVDLADIGGIVRVGEWQERDRKGVGRGVARKLESIWRMRIAKATWIARAVQREAASMTH